MTVKCNHKSFSRKLLSLLLAGSMLVSSLPAYALTWDDLAGDEAALREAVRGDENWEAQYPNGLFNFVGTQYAVEESRPFLEIAVARQGGTRGRASVDFKAIDVSAEYGKDYVIRVYENSAEAQLEKHERSVPLMNTVGDNPEVNISRGEQDGADAAVTGTVYGPASGGTEALFTDSVVRSVYGSASNKQSGDPGQGYQELEPEKIQFGGGSGGLSLRKLRENALGVKSDRPDWKEVDKDKVEQLKADYDRFVYSIPGAETTLQFEEGEYIKYLYIVPLNDSLPESEEQALFALVNPTGGAVRGEFYMAYANFQDDEAPEAVSFEWTADAVTAQDGQAAVKLRRVGGIHQYSAVTVGTEEDTAIANTDYIPGMQEVLFTPGMTEQSIIVDVLDNPARTEAREFTLALDRTNASVNPAGAEAQVTIPASAETAPVWAAGGVEEEADKARITALAADSQTVGTVTALAASATLAGAEKISPNGYSPARGQWAVVATDFLSGSTGGTAYAAGNDLRLRANGGEAYAYAKEVKLYGVSNAEFGWTNTGSGRSWTTQNWWPWWGKTSHYEEVFNTSFTIKAASGSAADLMNASGKRGWTVSRPAIHENVWNTAEVGFRTWASGGNSSEANLGWLRLYLKEYSLQVQNGTAAYPVNTYDINNGSLTQTGTTNKTLQPGTLQIKSIGSNVGNAVASVNATQANVFRSDRIEFTVSYASEELKNQFEYGGFELKLANGWKRYDNTSFLSLDAAFFVQSGVLDAIRNGAITVRPIFRQKNISLSIEADTASGYVDGISRSEGKASFNGLHAGDTVNIIAHNESTVKRFNWSSNNNAAFQLDASQSDDSRQQGRYTVPSTANNWLQVSFSNPSLTVQVNPAEYAHRVSRPAYQVDGVPYDDLESRTVKMEQIFAANADHDPLNDQNPELELSFAYEFDSSYPDGSKKADFGAASRAVLTVYASDGSIRGSYAAPSNNAGNSRYTATAVNGTFTFRGRLQDLGWQADDYATVIIYGSKKPAGSEQTIATKETAIDFLMNSGNAITASWTDGESDENVIKAGDIYTPVIIPSADPLTEYGMTSYVNPGFMATWMDYSIDLNGDGTESLAEYEEINGKLAPFNTSIEKIRRDWPVTDQLFWGNYFNYAPKYFNPTRVYYDFERISPSSNPAAASLILWEENATVIAPKIIRTTPLAGATVVIGNQSGVTNEKGELVITDPSFLSGRNYLGKVLHKGLEYYVTVTPGRVREHRIDFSQMMKPTELTASFTDAAGGAVAEIPLKNNGDFVPVRDGMATFQFKVEGSGGVAANDAVIRIYKTNLKQERTELVYEAETGFPTGGGLFTHSLNLLNAGIKPGYRMTISPVVKGQDGRVVEEYMEVDAGFVFSRELTAITALASFDTPLSPAVEFIGNMNNKFDLGMDISLEELAEWDGSKLTDKNGVDHSLKSISFGYNYSFESDDDEEEEEDGEAGGQAEEKGLADKVKEKLNENPDAMDKDKAKDKSVSNSYNFDFSISLALTLETYADGETYFRSMVLMASGEAEYGVKYNYVTPIGIPIFASVDISGDASAVLTVEALDINRILSPAEDVADADRAKYRFDGQGQISLNPQQYEVYAQFAVNPAITISAGAGVDWAKVTLSGSAAVDLSFTAPIAGEATASSGSGGLTISAEAGIKLLFIQKKWTIYQSKRINLFNYGTAAQAVMAALSDPYASYLYEPVVPVGEEELLSRDYLEQRSGWLGGDREEGRQVKAAAVQQSPETLLQQNVYPYPQTKLLELGDGRLLALYVDDTGERDSYNRAQLFYTVYNGSSWSQPQAVDGDATWDEAPSAFMVGDRVLVVWSDAGRVFTAGDTAVEVLSAMNISGRWFDTASASFTEPEFAITRDTGIDGFADLNPQISFDQVSGRLIVYFTKVDYEHTSPREYDPTPAADPSAQADTTTDGEESAVYGDIVNGYNVIAYRYAEQQSDGSFHWNEAYAVEEGYPEGFYGQRFLDLAVQADITETEVQRELAVQLPNDEDAPEGFVQTYTGTEQVVTPAASANADPLVIASDVISYNQLALYAYVLDQDSSRSTTEDQELYMQIYNYETGEFHHPVRLTNNGVQDTLPQFVRTKGITYLYWISGGDIVYMDITNLVKHHLKKVELTIGGQISSLYIVDKENTSINGFIRTAVEGKEGYPIDDFQIRSSGESQYLLWTDYVISYKNGLKPGDPGTENPVNINREKQIFAAFSEPQAELTHVLLTDAYVNNAEIEYIYGPEKGPGAYPEQFRALQDIGDGEGGTLPAGAVIEMDYRTIPDVNGYTGVVQAGDPVVQEQLRDSDGYPWSSPVQVTWEAGANYGDLSFVVNDDQAIQAMYVKYRQELGESGLFVENTDSRALATRIIAGEGAAVIGELELSAETPLAGNSLEFTAEVANTGLKPLAGLEYEAYVLQSGGETIVAAGQSIGAEAAPGAADKVLLGGGAFTLQAHTYLPEDITGITAGFRVRDAGGNVLLTAEKEVPAAANLNIAVSDVRLLDRNTAELSLFIGNNGNIPYNGKLDIGARTEGTILGSLDISLEPGAYELQLVEADLSGLSFGAVQTAADGSVYDQLELTLTAGGYTAQTAVKRVAGQSVAQGMNNVTNFSLHKTSLSMAAGTAEQLQAVKELAVPVPEGEADPTKVVWSTSNADVAAVLPDGTVIGLEPGAAVITASLMPDMAMTRTGADGTTENVDESYALPAGMIREKTIAVQVTPAPSGGEDNDGKNNGGTGNIGADNTNADNDGKLEVVSSEAAVVVRLKPAVAGATSAIEPDGNVAAASLERLKEEEGKSILDFAFSEEAVADAQQFRLLLSNEVIGLLAADSVLSAVAFEIPGSKAKMTLEKKTLAAWAATPLGELGIAALGEQEFAGVVLQISRVDSAAYPEELKKQLGNLPVYDFSVLIGGKLLEEVLPGPVPMQLELELEPGNLPAAGGGLNVNQIAGAVIAEDGSHSMLPLSVAVNGKLLIRARHSSVFAALYNPVSFGDVSGWAQPFIEFMAARDVIDGKAAGQFDPGSPVARGEFVKLLARIAGAEAVPVAASPFLDVTPDQWYAPYIQWARSEELVEGTGGGLFAPEERITRQDIAVLIARFAAKQGYTLPRLTEELVFRDSPNVSGYAAEAVSAVQQAGIIDGYPDGTFAPLEAATREQAAKMLAALVRLAAGE